MRTPIAAVVLFVCLPAFGQQAGTVTFDPPTTGGAPTGYRLYRDNVLVGPVTSGQTIQGLFPANTGTWVIAVESFNATGPGPKVGKTVTLGLPIPAPGPVIDVKVTAPCATATPPTCVITISGP